MARTSAISVSESAVGSMILPVLSRVPCTSGGGEADSSTQRAFGAGRVIDFRRIDTCEANSPAVAQANGVVVMPGGDAEAGGGKD